MVKSIVDGNPNLYLDKISFLFGIDTRKSVSWYNQVMLGGQALLLDDGVTDNGQTMNDTRFCQAMEIYLQSCPERLITVDETRNYWVAAIRRGDRVGR